MAPMKQKRPLDEKLDVLYARYSKANTKAKRERVVDSLKRLIHWHTKSEKRQFYTRIKKKGGQHVIKLANEAQNCTRPVWWPNKKTTKSKKKTRKPCRGKRLETQFINSKGVVVHTMVQFRYDCVVGLKAVKAALKTALSQKPLGPIDQCIVRYGSEEDFNRKRAVSERIFKLVKDKDISRLYGGYKVVRDGAVERYIPPKSLGVVKRKPSCSRSKKIRKTPVPSRKKKTKKKTTPSRKKRTKRKLTPSRKKTTKRKPTPSRKSSTKKKTTSNKKKKPIKKRLVRKRAR